MIKQRTLKNSVTAVGVGVHSGKKVRIVLRPAPVDAGVIFRRVDLVPVVEIPAKVNYIGATALSTSLEKDGVSVSTVEHLMSALAGMGIDNLFVDIDSYEVPIMDGSSAPFIFLLQSAVIVEQSAPKKIIRVKRTVTVEEEDKSISLSPFSGFKVDFQIDFDHPLFNESNQSISLDFSKCSYEKEVSRARTFGFVDQYEMIRKKNLALGASMSNTVVLDAFSVKNEDGFRYHNEPLKHKILDVVGDLYLLGYGILGAVSAYKSGHALNFKLLKELLACPDAYEVVSFVDEKESPALWFPSSLVPDMV